MNDSFGNISQDSLPAGYGDTPGKVHQRVGQPHPSSGEDAPTMENLNGAQDDYDGIFDIFRSPEREAKHDAKVAERAATKATATDSGDQDTSAFWANLLGKSSDSGESSSSSESDPGYRDLSYANDPYKYRQFADNSVEIMSGSNAGKVYSASSTTGKEIISRSGKYSATGGSSSDDFFSSISSGSKGAAIGEGIGAAVSQFLPSLMAILGPQEITEFDDESEDVEVSQAAGPKVGLIIGGVAVLGMAVAGFGFYAYKTRDDK